MMISAPTFKEQSLKKKGAVDLVKAGTDETRLEPDRA